MPDPRNRLKWNATCKVYPAAADLQAYHSIQRYLSEAAAGAAGDVYINSTACPAGYLWVVESIYSSCEGAALTWMRHWIKNTGGTEYPIDTVEAPATHHPLINSNRHVLEPGDYIRFGFLGVALAADILNACVTGYLIKTY